MAYSDSSSAPLKRCFKFYKQLNCQPAVLSLISEATELLFSKSVVDLAPCCFGSVEILLNQGFFLFRRCLSDNILQQLLYSSVVQWPELKNKASNLDSSQYKDVDLWCKSCSDFDCNKSWHQTPMDRLRWITFGYHYQWESRTYDESKRCSIPDEMVKLSDLVCQLLLFCLKTHPNPDPTMITVCSNFRPEAVIVNYYRGKTTMGFHTDEVEFDKHAPLISVSLGRSGVFLLEVDEPLPSNVLLPHTKALPEVTNVVPVVLHHGDVVVMLGRSRLARHAVPALLDHSTVARSSLVEIMCKRCTRCLSNGGCAPDTCPLCSCFGEYVATTRINFNIRQVVPFGSCFHDFLST